LYEQIIHDTAGWLVVMCAKIVFLRGCLFCDRTAVPDFSLAPWRADGEMCQSSVNRQQMSHDSDASLRGGGVVSAVIARDLAPSDKLACNLLV